MVSLATVTLISNTAPPKSWSHDVDVAAIERILGDDALVSPSAPNPDQDKKMVDLLASSETKLLGQGDASWTPANPRWQPVFERVHADFEMEMPGISTTGHDYEAIVASQMTQADMDSLLAYYKTPQGRRYQDFIKRINQIMGSGTASLIGVASPPSAPAQLSPDQQKRGVKMLMLSRAFQSIIAMSEMDKAAHRDTSGYGAISFVLAAAMNKNPQELAALDQVYAGDLSDFEAFSKTDASRHLYQAIGVAAQKTTRTVLDSVKRIVQKNGDDWKALYKNK